MKNNYSNILIFICLLSLSLSYSQTQDWRSPLPLTDLNCHVEVNENRSELNNNQSLKDAVFRFSLNGSTCSGTLLNRNVPENQVGQYFITAWHCFKSGDICGGGEYDFNLSIIFRFNFQSPPDHLGLVFADNRTGDMYSISRNVRLVEHLNCAYGDFALCEILGEPIPPHFMPYYTGWYPNAFKVTPFDEFINISHPAGSIKKGAKVASNGLSQSPTTVLQTSCITTTKVVDVLFGWIWGRRWVTESVCSYVQIPFLDSRYYINYAWGQTEEGSSGSGVFNATTGKLYGNLSGSMNDACGDSFNTDWYGKFFNFYPKSGVRNVLNPSQNDATWLIDQTGIPGRRVMCYENVTYNEPYTFYPHKLHKANNVVTINVANDFVFNNVLTTIKPESEYVFNVGGTFDSGTTFEVEDGVTNFEVNSGVGCSVNTSTYRKDNGSEYESVALMEMVQKFKTIEIPDHLEFDEAKYLKNIDLEVFPNPSSGNVQVSGKVLKAAQVHYEVYNSLLGSMKSGVLNVLEQSVAASVDLSTLPSGVYMIVFSDGLDNKQLIHLVKY